MTTKTATEARAQLYNLVDEVSESHDPVLITGRRANAVLISEKDWNSVQETLYLTSIPGMRKAIQEGLKRPVSKCARKLKW